jgi:hypothetical protein
MSRTPVLWGYIPIIICLTDLPTQEPSLIDHPDRLPADESGLGPIRECPLRVLGILENPEQVVHR